MASSTIDGENSDNNNYIPSSILMDILGRIPLKTLVYCRIVQKSWRSLLTETCFHKLYSHHMPSTLILHRNVMLKTLDQISLINDPSCAVVGSIDALSPTLEMSMMRPLTYKLDNHDIQSSLEDYLDFEYGNGCNGLVCLNETETQEPSVIWNPIMGQYVILPKPPTNPVEKVVAGFGFCGRTNQYKVLRIFHVSRDYRSSRQRVEIYDVGVGEKWRKIKDSPFLIPSTSPGFYINNSLHWILHYHGKRIYNQDINMSSNSELIARFDLVEESFKAIKAPPIYSPNRKKEYYWSNLGIIGSCLSICAIDAEVFTPDAQVWVMEEYGEPESWALRFSIRAPPVQWWDPYRRTQVTNILNNGDMLIILCADTCMLYNLRKRQLEEVKSLDFPPIAHVPSFISLEDILSQHHGTRSLKVRYL